MKEIRNQGSETALTEIYGNISLDYAPGSVGYYCTQKLIYLYFSFITGSYDRTCKVWDTESGEELRTLEGHRNVVYAIAFNNPYG